MEARAGFPKSQVQGCVASLRWNATHPVLRLSARAAPDKLKTNLTLSSAERRRFAARTGATINGAREQDPKGPKYDQNRHPAQEGLFAFGPKSRQKPRKVRDLSETAAAALSLPHDGGEQVIHIEHEYLFATVSNPAEQQTRGVRTAFAVPVDVRFLDRNLVTIALRGQRELFVAVQGNHTRQSAGPA